MKTDIDPEEFGKALGGLIREALQPLARRIAALELATNGTDTQGIDDLADEILNGDGRDE